MLYSFRFKSFPIKVVHRRAPRQQSFYMGKSRFLTFKCILIDHDPKLNTEKEFLVNGEGRVSLPLSIEKKEICRQLMYFVHEKTEKCTAKLGLIAAH